MILFSLLIAFVKFSLVRADCPTGSVYNSDTNRCYFFATEPVMYFAAENKCMEWGGHLTSITNGFENYFLMAHAQTSFTAPNTADFWIGANVLLSPDWSWLDKTPFTFHNWAPGEPYTSNGQRQCASSNLNNGNWKASACSSVKPYICSLTYVPQTKVQTTTTSTTTTTTRPGHCNNGHYFKETDSCYSVYYDEDWQDAEATCRSDGAHLTSIHSDSENDFIEDITRTGGSGGNDDQVWIGLFQYDKNSRWEWSDGSSFDYENWADGEPSDSWGNEHCVQFRADNNDYSWVRSWNDIKCSDKMRAFVCKKKAFH